MLGNFVVVDIETTGNKVSNGDTIIQFSAVKVNNSIIVEQYTTFVNPKKPIPNQISTLTNITDIDVKDAPLFEDVIEQILEFIGESVFVAHNVHFDFEFLNDLFIKYGKKRLTNNKIDTVEFSRVLLPMFTTYKLDELCFNLNIPLENHHRADADALATARLLLVLLEKWDNIPSLVKLRMRPHLNNLQNNYSFLYKETDDTGDYDAEQYLNISEKSLLVKNIILSKNKNQIAQSKQETFKKREEQEALIKFIEKGLQDNKSMIIEAPPGIGKTLSYLLAGLTSNKKLIVTTSTIMLQEQLIKTEIPKLERVIGKHLNTVVLKGKSNYVCLDRFVTSLSKTNDTYDISLTKSQILVWLIETLTGDKDELSLPSGGTLYWENICCNGDCIEGSNHAHCFYRQTVEKLDHSNIIVTNHHTLIKYLQKSKDYLLKQSVIIIDEAHQFEKAINSSLTSTVEIKKILFYISKLGTLENEKTIANVSEIISKNTGNMNVYDDINYYLTRARILLEQIVEGIKIGSKNEADIISENSIVNIQKNINIKEWKSILSELNKSYSLTIDFYKQFSSFIPRQNIAIIEEFINYCVKLSDQIKDLVVFFEKSKSLRWIEIERNIYYEAKLQCLNTNSDEQLSLLNDESYLKILISGTLTVKGSFSFILKNLGINTSYRELLLSSNYFSNLNLFIPNNLPSISKNPNDICTLVIEHLKSYINTQEKILVLFTSHEMLRYTYQLAQRNNQLKNIIFAQNITSSSKQKLTKMFVNAKEGILFGTETFWEGVDFPGKLLTTLVIVRLPFLPPTHPYIQIRAKKDTIKNNEKFAKICLPDATFRFKQGVGRLIRGKDDSGKLIIFDKRIVESNYRSLFLNTIGNPQVNYFSIYK